MDAHETRALQSALMAIGRFKDPCPECQGFGWSDFTRHRTGPGPDDYDDELISCETCDGSGLKKEAPDEA